MALTRHLKDSPAIGRRLTTTAAVLALTASLLSSWSSPARAAQLITWTTTSRYVDVTKATFNSPPPGVAPRPPALRVNVLLPDGYDGHRRFPVLYLLHGHGDSYDSWVNPQDGDLLNIAKGLPAIVIMPEAATGWYTNWWDGGARGSDGRGWEDYHLNELIPLVQSRLAILPGRSNHAIAGLSMGGEGAIYYAEQRPGYFGSAASFSGVLSLLRPEWPAAFDTQGQNHLDVYGDPSAQSFYWSGHDPVTLAPSLRHTRLFISVGDGTNTDPTVPSEINNYFGSVAEAELHQHAQDFVAAAQAAGDDVTYQSHGGLHDWPWWRADLLAAMQWGLFRPVPESPSDWSYRTVSQAGRAWDLSYSFQQPPETLQTLTRIGDTLTATGSGTVRIVPDGRPAFTATLPFTRTLAPPTAAAPSHARRHRRPRHHRRRHHRHHHPRPHHRRQDQI